MNLNFSVLIITYNEEINIRKCLDALSNVNDIIVIDSFSSDKTLDILRGYSNVRVFQRKFDDFANQRNFGLEECDLRHSWVLHLDADEVVDDDFLEECYHLAQVDEKSGYWVSSKLIFLNKWIRYASGFPVYQMRFMKLGDVKFVQIGHGQREGESKRGLGYIKNSYLHYNFSKGLSDWFNKHNRYSSAEASYELNVDNVSFLELWSKNETIKRRALKNISYKFPFRPFLKFCYLYFFKLGFLDGSAGYFYCRLMAIYEIMILLKKKEKFYNKF